MKESVGLQMLIIVSEAALTPGSPAYIHWGTSISPELKEEEKEKMNEGKKKEGTKREGESEGGGKGGRQGERNI